MAHTSISAPPPNDGVTTHFTRTFCKHLPTPLRVEVTSYTDEDGRTQPPTLEVYGNYDTADLGTLAELIEALHKASHEVAAARRAWMEAQR